MSVKCNKKHICKRDYIWIPSRCACKYDKACEIGEYLKNYTDNL